MKSIFLRRVLVAMILVIVFTSVVMSVGYGIIGGKMYVDIKLRELVPRTQMVADLIEEYQCGNVTYDSFSRMMTSYLQISGVAAVIVDEEKTVAYTSCFPECVDNEEISKSLSGIYDRVINGESVSESSRSIDGIGLVLVVGVPIYSPCRNIAGGVVVLQRVEAVAESMRPITTLFYVCIIGGAVLMLLTMAWRIRLVTDPLHRMSEVAIEMSKGNFDVRAKEQEQGEVGLLARALNTLCENLSSTIYQLRAEKGQLDELLQSLSDGVAAMDGSGAITHYNTELMRMFGVVNVEKREDLIKDPMIWKIFEEVFASGEPQTITYPMAGDKTLWITVTPVTTEEGERTGVVGLFKDMTEMERTERMRREYVANVSHELRTPLTAVRGLLEPLADGMVKNEEDKQRYYKIMLHEVMRLSRLITDTLKLSRLQAGTEYMELVKVNLEELISDVATGYTAAAQEKGISLEIDCAHTGEALTDPDRIEQVLVILLDNAMRYTPSGGVIKIRLRSGKKLIVSVEDNGCGIPEKDIPHIFERFYKVDKSRGEGGTGLGLSIAKFIMEKLDEDITVHSEKGKGTCFTFTAKRYVSNAIELGPANETRKAAEKEKIEKPDFEDDEDGIRDADYEVVNMPEPEKKKSKKKADIHITKHKE